MKRTSYRDHDYAFGQMMLTLRSALGLTQTGLAEILHVSRRSVADWESGSKYPKADRLKALITLGIEHNAFHSGYEEEEIRALWKASKQKVLLDEPWILGLLGAKTPLVQRTNTAALPNGTRVDWSEALTVPTFYGRDWETKLLIEWVIEQRCQVIGIVGIGGIGKSALTIRLMHQIAPNFEVVIWRTVRNAPECAALLDDCLRVLIPQPFTSLPADFQDRLDLFSDYLRKHRILLVLDNLETVLEDKEHGETIRPSFEHYEQLLRHLGQTNHQSCLLFTSREKPASLIPLEGSQSPVRSLQIGHLGYESCQALLAEKGVTGTASLVTSLIDSYAGNPLALKIVSQTIVNLFDGDINAFIDQGEIIFGGVRKLLTEQFERLSAAEQQVLIGLALVREPVTLKKFLEMLITPMERGLLFEAVEALYRRSLVERGTVPAGFTLQSVVMEFATNHLMAELCREIQSGELTYLCTFSLELPTAKEFLRQTLLRVLVTPLLSRLTAIYRRSADVEARILSLLRQLQMSNDRFQGYAPANLLTLLKTLRGHLRDLDLSGLTIHRPYLQGVDMQDTTLKNATIEDGVFTETFNVIIRVVVTADGQYWAASTESGQVRMWNAGAYKLHRVWQVLHNPIYRFALNADGRILAGGTGDGQVQAYDTNDGRLLWSAKWPGSLHVIFSLSFSPNGNWVVCTGDDSDVRFLDAETGQMLQVLKHPHRVITHAWRYDGELLATADAVGVVRVWSMREANFGSIVWSVEAHQSAVFGLVFSPDGRLLATSGRDGGVKIWDLERQLPVETLDRYQDDVIRLNWSQDNSTLAISTPDHAIALWDRESRTFRTVIQGHTAKIRALAFAKDGNVLISSSQDGTLRVWDSASGECLRVLHGYVGGVTAIAWSPDGQQIAGGGADMTVSLYSAHNGELRQVLQGHSALIKSVSWSPDGRWLASAERLNKIRIWETTSNTCVHVLQHPTDKETIFWKMAWSPDAALLAAGTLEHGLMFWRQDGSILNSPPAAPHAALLSRVVWSSDGTEVITGAEDGKIYVWNTHGGVNREFVAHQGQVFDIDSHSDGKLVTVTDSEWAVWDLDYQVLLFRLPASSANSFTSVVFGITSNHVITGGSDGRVCCWDAQSGECLWQYDAHAGTIFELRRSPDNSMVASSGDDGKVILWDLHSGGRLQSIRRERPYERVDIGGIRGLTAAQKANLHALGAVKAEP